jgi:hypothetical protein
MDKTKRICTLSFLIIIGFSFSLIYHYAQGIYLNNPYPANTFLFAPKFHFTDFWDITSESINLNPYLGEKSGQYPFMILIGKVFGLLPESNSVLLFLLIGIAGFAYFAKKYLSNGPWYSQATSVFVICFLSYPFLFTIDRGNFELLLFLLLLVFLYLFEKKKYLWSTIPLAMAIAIKVYPAILLFLFIPEKKWKEFFISIGFSIALTLGSLCLFQDGFSQNVLYLFHLSNFSNNGFFELFTSIEPGAVVQRGVTVVSLIKIVLGNASIAPTQFWIDHFKIIYIVCAAIIGIGIIIFVVFKQKVFWKRVAVLIFLMLLLPPISGDYKLIHLFLPLFLFCNEEKNSKLDNLYVLFFAILLIPKDYYFYPKLSSDATINYVYVHDISIAIPINIVVLMIFAVILLLSNKFDRNNKIKETTI